MNPMNTGAIVGFFCARKLMLYWGIPNSGLVVPSACRAAWHERRGAELSLLGRRAALVKGNLGEGYDHDTRSHIAEPLNLED